MVLNELVRKQTSQRRWCWQEACWQEAVDMFCDLSFFFHEFVFDAGHGHHDLPACDEAVEAACG